MALKRHHKFLIGGISGIVVIYMITSGILLYLLFVRVELIQSDQSKLEQSLQSQLIEVQGALQTEVNQLSSALDITKKDLATQLSEIKASTSADFSGIIEESIPAVVTIRTDISQGSGFIIKDSGYLITNSHVLSGASKAVAITSDQEQKNAELIGWSSDYDVALLKISGDFNALELEDSNNVNVGEKVIAIGNPVGLQFSVSEGIVSAVDREISGSPGKYIQTDAALNPGNSGGPLINKKGQVIGINNFKIGGFESLGFALQSEDIKFIVNEIAQQQLNQTLI